MSGSKLGEYLTNLLGHFKAIYLVKICRWYVVNNIWLDCLWLLDITIVVVFSDQYMSLWITILIKFTFTETPTKCVFWEVCVCVRFYTTALTDNNVSSEMQLKFKQHSSLW